MTMIVVNIHEIKAKLSEYVEAAARGERVLICKRNQPVAELRAVASQRTTPRPIGLAKDTVTIPPEFFDPLPENLLTAFSGEQAAARRRARVAEPTPVYGGTRKKRSRR